MLPPEPKHLQEKFAKSSNRAYTRRTKGHLNVWKMMPTPGRNIASKKEFQIQLSQAEFALSNNARLHFSHSRSEVHVRQVDPTDIPGTL